MKTILAPVDFSDTSLNALSFAAELSKKASARLVVINISEKDKNEKIKNKLKLIGSDLEKNFGADLKLESLVEHGELISTLKKTIANYQPDLLVMGTKGASGLKKMLIGSNTVNVIANTNTPVLVIPEAAQFENFKGRNRIVLATDLELLENDAILDILREIALFIEDPKLRVVSVRPKYTTLPDLKRLERDHLLSFFSPDIDTERITVFSSNVMSGINFYLEENHGDTGLIAMIARDSGHLIQKHYTREMASHTYLPLLVLHEK